MHSMKATTRVLRLDRMLDLAGNKLIGIDKGTPSACQPAFHSAKPRQTVQSSGSKAFPPKILEQRLSVYE